MIHDLLRAVAVAVMMHLACVMLFDPSGLAGLVLCWGVPLVLGAIALASLRIVRRMQQHGAWEDDDV